MAACQKVAAIDGRARLDTLRPDRPIVAGLHDHPERRVELAIHAFDVRDCLQLGDGGIGDGSRHGREAVRAGLEWLHGHETQVADGEDRAANVVLRTVCERDQQDDEGCADRNARGRES